MRRFRSFISALLVIIMILMIQSVTAEDVSAAKKKFSNVKFENNVLTWDPIENLKDSYTIKVSRKSDNYSVTLHYTFPKFDMNSYYEGIGRGPYYKEGDLLTSGPVKITLSAKDTKGKSYQWSSTVDYVDRIIHRVGDIKWEGDKLSWEHNRYNIPQEAGLTYQISVYVDYGETLSFPDFEFYTADTVLSTTGFALTGTHRYYISVYPTVKNYINAISGNQIEVTREISASSGITGMSIRDGVLKWDAYPEADSYLIRYKYYGPSMFGGNNLLQESSEKVTVTTRDLISRFYNVGARDNLVNVRIAALKGEDQITPFAEIIYTVDTSLVTFYPLYIHGTRLDMYNYKELPGKYTTYDPSSNTLTVSEYDSGYWPYDENTAYYSTEDLTVTGKFACGMHQGGFNRAFDCDKTLTFAKGFEMTHRSERTAIHAKNIVFNEGTFSLENNREDTVIADNDITIRPGCVLEAVTGEGKAAIRAAGKIDLRGSKITVPQGGKLDSSGHTVLNSDGTVASHVKIEPIKAAPTSKPEPTAKVTAKPTAKVTAKVTAKPTAKATSQVTQAPVKPTPKITSKPTVMPDDPSKSINSFVERIYKFVLDREPEADGAAFWTDELYSFRRTGAEVGLQFIFSDEFVARDLSDEEFVTVLYKTFFDRSPEAEGLEFWTSSLASGSLDRRAVANGFVFSQEWADTCASYGIRSGGDVEPSVDIVPSSATLAFVERMYTTAMNRESDASGLEFWSSELANFRYTGEQVGVMFFLSEEMQGFGLSDNEFVTRLYKTFMDRDPEEGGFDFWVGYLSDGGSRSDVVCGFTRSEEFVNKCIEARILPY